ncbi:MAG: TonB family protein [Saprospiraceae bacterium]
MINYLLEVSICWTAFYLIYVLWLSKETFFKTNRWYLVVTLLLGLVLPLVEFPVAEVISEEEFGYLETITVTVGQVESQIATVVATPISESVSIQEVLLWIYGFGFLFMSFRFLIGLAQIIKHYKSSEKEQNTEFTFVKNEKFHLPFSFFHYLFISKSAEYESDELKSIIRHELIHIKEKHSVDVLLAEILSIVFWCSPLVYLYRMSLRNVHEYLADHNVLQTTTKKQYGLLLLQQFQKGPGMAMANNFIHSQLKKRIKMMTRNQSTNTARWKYLLALPVFLCLLFVLAKTDLFAQQNEKITANENRVHPVMKVDNGDPIYKVVDQMPRFPGCEDLEKSKKDACSKQQLLEFVYKNVRYPEDAQKEGIEGTTVIKFVVDKTGKVTQPEIVRNVGGGCAEEALRVVQQMPYWIPGKRNGENVAVYYNLPVKFKLDGESKVIETKVKETKKETSELSDDIFIVVEEMPRFPGCEDITNAEERKNCSRNKLLQFIYSNVKYPKEAQEAGVEGMVVVRFVIDQNGNVIQPEIIRSKSHGLDEAVLDVVDEMMNMEEKWIPGKQRGKKVKVAYNLPVKFKLDPNKDCAEKSEKSDKTKNHMLEVANFSMSPNPAKNEVQISFDMVKTEGLSLSLTDASGRVLKTQRQFTEGENNLSLDISEAAAGVLFVTLQQDGKTFTKQLMKQ